jgi:hypothetical protein
VGGVRNTKGPGSQFYTPVFVFSTSVSSLAVVVVAVSADSDAGVVVLPPRNAAGVRVVWKNDPRASGNT